jgi:hypothetical protein
MGGMGGNAQNRRQYAGISIKPVTIAVDREV